MQQVGLIGYPVAHSRSPQMHNAAFRAIGFNAEYALWETLPETLRERVTSLRTPTMLGANVTIPYKEDVVPLLDQCDVLAARIGAVNTIVNRDGKLIGYNTDAPGFLRALAQCPGPPFASRGKETVILGTGGAARAAAIALLDSGAHSVSVLGRQTDRIAVLLRHLHRYSHAPNGHPILRGALFESVEARIALREAHLVVNATSVGLTSSDAGVLIDVNLLPVGSLVMDMIFNVGMTPLLQAAQARGCFVMHGLPMLLYQGTLAFELWTGKAAPVEVMRNALELSIEKTGK